MAASAVAAATTTLKAPGKLSTRVLEKEKEKEREERDRKRRLAGLLGVDPSETTEPTMMICPETGVLIPMQEAEEGQYVPVPGGAKQPIIIMGKVGAQVVLSGFFYSIFVSGHGFLTLPLCFSLPHPTKTFPQHGRARQCRPNRFRP